MFKSPIRSVACQPSRIQMKKDRYHRPGHAAWVGLSGRICETAHLHFRHPRQVSKRGIASQNQPTTLIRPHVSLSPPSSLLASQLVD
jgi:hypothetical protein